MRYYVTTVRAKGIFKRQWSSHLSYAKVKLDIKKHKLIILKKYGQKLKGHPNQWFYPWFPPKELELLKERAYWNYNTFVLNQQIINHNKKDKNKKIQKHHKEELCERCLELGHYCKFISPT